MPDDIRLDADEPYEAPTVEDIESESGPAVTAAGATIVQPDT